MLEDTGERMLKAPRSAKGLILEEKSRRRRFATKQGGAGTSTHLGMAKKKGGKLIARKRGKK
jgi:hypothetical protein